MTRILTLLSIILLLVCGWYIYSQNILGKILNPTVIVLQLKEPKDMSESVSPTDLTLYTLNVNDLKPAMITFPKAVTEEEILSFLRGKRTREAIPVDDIISITNFGPIDQVYQVRVMGEFNTGDTIEPSMLDVFNVVNPDTGTLTFVTQEEADLFILNDGESFVASNDIQAGRAISMSDVAGGGNGVFVLKTARNLLAETPISPADVFAENMPGEAIPRGAISFPSQSGADIFVTASGDLALSYAVTKDSVITSDMIKVGAGRVLKDFSSEDAPLPETFQELVEFQAQAPLDVKFINLSVNFPELEVQAYVPLVGGKPVEGGKMDLWVETDRTTGPFGTIRLRRFIDGIDINRVVDPELVLAERERRVVVEETEVSGATPPVDQNDVVTSAAKGVFYWANVTRSGGLALEEAKDDGRIAFMMSSDTPISDFLGNGVICREDLCTISNSVTNDLESVRILIAELQGETIETIAEAPPLAPFSVLDGVTIELENVMHAAGYETFEDIARWEDGQIQVIEFELSITRNLTLYIREQARTIVNMPTQARQDLGIARPVDEQ